MNFLRSACSVSPSWKFWNLKLLLCPSREKQRQILPICFSLSLFSTWQFFGETLNITSAHPSLQFIFEIVFILREATKQTKSMICLHFENLKHEWTSCTNVLSWMITQLIQNYRKGSLIITKLGTRLLIIAELINKINLFVLVSGKVNHLYVVTQNQNIPCENSNSPSSGDKILD